MRILRLWAASFSSVAVLFFCVPSGAAEPDISTGGALATEHCSRCHAVGASGKSPLPDAVPFRTLGKKYPLEDLEEALAEGIATGHPDMPEFELTTEEIDSFIGYLKTVQEK